ncbi:MAG: GNAT family N-acetyltransferase [Dehalococcoidales bacterium]
MLQIRRYQPQDNKVVRELNDAGIAQIEPSGELRALPFVTADFDDIEGVYLKNGDFIVGLQEGEVVAMGAFKKRTAKCAEFKRLRIRPDCQRKGYGEAIMLKLMEMAAEMGYTEGFLDTLTTNTRAQRLFEKLGFKKSGRGKRGSFDLLFYTRQLNKGGN